MPDNQRTVDDDAHSREWDDLSEWVDRLIEANDKLRPQSGESAKSWLNRTRHLRGAAP